MNEWLFTYVVLAFVTPTEAVVVDGGAYIGPSEEACTKAMSLAKEKFKEKLALVTCDPIKPGIPVERKRGNRI